MAYTVDPPFNSTYDGQDYTFYPKVVSPEGSVMQEGQVLDNSLVYNLMYYEYDQYNPDDPIGGWTSDEQRCVNAGHYLCEITFTITNPERYRFNDEQDSESYEELTDKTVYVMALDWKIRPRTITATPYDYQKAVGTPDPILEFYYSGNVSDEVPGFTGELAREPGELVGVYPITQGSLSLADHGNFMAFNYTLEVRSGSFVISGSPTTPGGGSPSPAPVLFGKITLKSADVVKEYDGNPAVDDTVTITCSESVSDVDMELLRSAFTFNVYGSQTLVGVSLNYFTYTVDESILYPPMYTIIEKIEGRLQVTNRQGN